MTWNRHRQTQPEEINNFEKAVKETAEKAIETEVKTEEITPPLASEDLKEELKPVEEEKVEIKAPEVKKKVKKAVKKKRVDTKIFNNVGIVGDTIEAKEFRAIIKREGWQINTVLTGLISKWNKKNYNL